MYPSRRRRSDRASFVHPIEHFMAKPTMPKVGSPKDQAYGDSCREATQM
jgi:hypothetical protein